MPFAEFAEQAPLAKITGLRSLAKPRIVCIPVTAADLDLLPATLLSVLNHTTAESDILLLAVGIDPALLQNALPESITVAVTSAPVSADPWQAVLQEWPARNTRHDLLLLRPGIEVPPNWDARLALAAYREPGIAAVVPLCDSAEFVALLESPPDQVDLARIDRLLFRHSPRRHHEIPALFSGCCYLRRAALRLIEAELAIQPAMTAGDWCQWLAQTFREQGWQTVSGDHVYVLDHAPDRRRQEMAAIAALEDVRLIGQAHPLAGLRQVIRESLEQDAATDPELPSALPAQLHIAHSWGGGLDYWIRQYCEMDRTRSNLVLRSIGTWGAFGQRIALYQSAVMDQPLRYWDLDYPIRATATAHGQYRAILREIIADFAVEAVLISSLIGHALDALATGLPTVIVAHDYYPFCPAVVIQFGEVCHQCALPRLERCFAENGQNRFFRNVGAMEWLSLRRRFARLAVMETVQFVVPAPAVARHWQSLVPELHDKAFNVIAHGLDFAPPRLPAPLVGERLRVVVLGSLAPQKGRVLLEQLWPLIAEQVELLLIGADEDGEAFRNQPGITLIPRYQPDQLAALLMDFQPEVGLLLSVWPETFSYTLSELWLLGLPVVATNLGSFADRIQDGVNGFLCEPQAEAVATRLLAIAANRASLTPIRERLANFQHRSVAAMVADYHALIPLPVCSAPRYFRTPASALSPSASPNHGRVLSIDVRAPFGEALREFGQYAGQKLVATPRLRQWQKRGLAVLLRWSLRAAAALARTPCPSDLRR